MKTFIKTGLLMCLVLALLAALSACGKGLKKNTAGSPEELIEAYFNANIDGDVDAIVSLMPPKFIEKTKYENGDSEDGAEKVKQFLTERCCYLANAIEEDGLQKSDISFEIVSVEDMDEDYINNYRDFFATRELGELQDAKTVTVTVNIKDESLSVERVAYKIDGLWCLDSNGSDKASFSAFRQKVSFK